jgi:hypothetical protein
MRMCPHCHKNTIPWLHAYVTTKWAAPIACSNCGAHIKRVFDNYGAVSVIPIGVAALVCNNLDVQPINATYFFIVFGGLFGVSLGEHTIRYIVVNS